MQNTKYITYIYPVMYFHNTEWAVYEVRELLPRFNIHYKHQAIQADNSALATLDC